MYCKKSPAQNIQESCLVMKRTSNTSVSCQPLSYVPTVNSPVHNDRFTVHTARWGTGNHSHAGPAHQLLLVGDSSSVSPHPLSPSTSPATCALVSPFGTVLVTAAGTSLPTGSPRAQAVSCGTNVPGSAEHKLHPPLLPFTEEGNNPKNPTTTPKSERKERFRFQPQHKSFPLPSYAPLSSAPGPAVLRILWHHFPTPAHAQAGK